MSSNRYHQVVAVVALHSGSAQNTISCASQDFPWCRVSSFADHWDRLHELNHGVCGCGGGFESVAGCGRCLHMIAYRSDAK